MAEEITETPDLERLKRYLQWATALVLVAVAVTAIDLTIKQGILRAVKEATKVGESPVTYGAGNASNFQPDNPMDRAARSSENSHTDASSRFSVEASTADSEADESSSDVV